MPAAPTRPLPAYGALTTVMRDHVYEFSGRGFLFTSPWVHTHNTRRHAATILLTVDGDPLVVTSAHQQLLSGAVLVPPWVARSLHAHDRGLVSINITPNHWSFSLLRHLGGSLLRPLDPAPYRCLAGALARAYAGELTNREAEQLAEDCVVLTLEQLPGAAPRQRHTHRTHDTLMHIVDRDETLSLPEVADRLHLSYDRASHVVSSTLGLSLKSYQYWRKMASAWGTLTSDESLTQAAQAGGFSDSAHLTRTWKQKLGTPPSYIRDARRVRVIR